MHQERTEVDTPALPSSSLPADENVRFPIAKVVLENDSGKFYFLRHISRDYEGRELSLKDINEAVSKMNRELMQRGFSTSRVVIPEQNLSEGTLRLVLQIGRIHAVRFAEGSDTLYIIALHFERPVPDALFFLSSLLGIHPYAINAIKSLKFVIFLHL